MVKIHWGRPMANVATVSKAEELCILYIRWTFLFQFARADDQKQGTCRSLAKKDADKGTKAFCVVCWPSRLFLYRATQENEWWRFPTRVGIYRRWPWCKKAFIIKDLVIPGTWGDWMAFQTNIPNLHTDSVFWFIATCRKDAQVVFVMNWYTTALLARANLLPQWSRCSGTNRLHSGYCAEILNPFHKWTRTVIFPHRSFPVVETSLIFQDPNLFDTFHSGDTDFCRIRHLQFVTGPSHDLTCLRLASETHFVQAAWEDTLNVTSQNSWKFLDKLLLWIFRTKLVRESLMSQEGFFFVSFWCKFFFGYNASDAPALQEACRNVMHRLYIFRHLQPCSLTHHLLLQDVFVKEWGMYIGERTITWFLSCFVPGKSDKIIWTKNSMRRNKFCHQTRETTSPKN